MIYSVAAAVMMALSLAGCRETPLIGPLAGQWQITHMTDAEGHDVTVSDRYYCFYRHTAQLTAPGETKITANMTYDNPSLSLEFAEDSPVFLTDWGVTPPPDATAETRNWVEHYHIDRLDNDHLVMTTAEGITITLRKY